MKTVLVVIDGLGDAIIPELGGRTPLESAFIPNIHFIATNGLAGRIDTVFEGFPIESMVCIMGLLGYEPEKFYPSGRASFEALAKGIPLNSEDLVLRCNIVSLDKEKKVITDFTAGLISDSDAKKVVSKIKLPFSNWELYPGQSYRNILVIRDGNIDPKMLKCFEPHMNIGGIVNELLPQDTSNYQVKLVGEIQKFLLSSIEQIEVMELPKHIRADMLWVWSPSQKPNWPSFHSRTGLNAAFVGALDFLHGIAMASDIHFDIIPGATGYVDTDYTAKAEFAKRYLDGYDFVLVHVNSTDEEAHQHNFQGKLEAIQKIDHQIIGPVLLELEKKYKNDFRIIICGDHETRSTDGKHGNAPVPFALYGNQVIGDGSFTKRFCEKNVAGFKPIPSLDFLKYITRDVIVKSE